MVKTMYIASLDVGTSTIRCHIFDNFGNTVGKASAEVEVLYPTPGFVEIEPDLLWERILSVIKTSIADAGLNPEHITCLGISSQRCTFITWNKKTGQYYHNFITWKDLRANDMINNLNDSYIFKALRLVSKVIYTFSGWKKYLVGSILKFLNGQVAIRLLWVLKNIEGISKGIENNEVLFGTIDTWILYKLTNKQLHVTDLSCASPTGLFDPFTLTWGDWILKLLRIPTSILPKLVDSCGPNHLGFVHPSIFGASIPITASIADQSASVFGSLCFEVGDIKITLGTGTFLDLNTGTNPHASVEGVYPVIGWKYEEELVYLAEALSNDTGALTKWAVESGLVTNLEDSAKIAQSVEDNGGVYFVAAFSGIQAPVHDPNAASGFIGIKPTTTKEHMLRAVLESVAFRVAQMFNMLIKEINCSTKLLKVDGGVSQNDFVLQFLANMINTTIEQNSSSEISVLGAAYLAGLGRGIWKDKDELYSLNRKVFRTEPSARSKENYQKLYTKWLDAVYRFCGWYK